MRYTTLILALFLTSSLLGQRGAKTEVGAAGPDTATIIAHYEKAYSIALSYSDLSAATDAVYSMLAYHPDDLAIKDTLARLYFTRGLSVQALLVGMEVLDAQPENQAIMEVVAVSQENLGLAKEALDSYEKLFGLTQSNYYKYQMASLQYRLKRLGECQANLNALLQAEDVETQKITMTYGQQGSQEVSMKAAVVNMLGVLALEVGKKDDAKQLFEQSLELEPEFLLAAANLQSMNEEENKEEGDSN